MRILSICLGLVALSSANLCKPASSGTSRITTTSTASPGSTTSTSKGTSTTSTTSTSSSTSTTGTTTTTETTTVASTTSSSSATPTPFEATISSTASNVNNKVLQWSGEYVSIDPIVPGWQSSPFYIEDGTNYLKAGDLYITWYDGNSGLYTLDESYANGPEKKKIVCNKVDAAGSLSCYVGEQPSINYFYVFTQETDTISVYMSTGPLDAPADTASLTLIMSSI